MRGNGRVYTRPGSPFLWMEFWQDGRPIRKSTKKTTAVAAGSAKKRVVKRARPRKVTERKTRAKATRAKLKANPKPKPAVAAKA